MPKVGGNGGEKTTLVRIRENIHGQFYAEDWGEVQLVGDDWQVPDKVQRLSQMGVKLYINPSYINSRYINLGVVV